MRFSNLYNDFNSYQQLITFYQDNKDESFSDIHLELSDFFSADLSAVLGSILDIFLSNSNTILFDNLGSRIELILKKNGFLSYFGYKSEIDNYSTTIKYQKILPVDGKYFKSYIENELINSNLSSLSKMSKGVKNGIIEAIYEIFVNAQIHSETKYIYSCGQLFPKKNELVFTLVDRGISIKNCVNKRFGSNLSSIKAIEWALRDRNTTKKDITGGIGLALLKEFIIRNKGIMQIISNDGYYSFNEEGEEYRLFVGQFPGTIINIKFKTDDVHSYSLKSEEKINLENIF